MNYQDIIHEQRPCAVGQMGVSAADRAAQFAPFAALTGFDGVISETGRLTDDPTELDENEAQRLDEALRALQEKLPQRPQVQLIWYCPDSRKSGGAYLTYLGNLKRIDEYNRCLVFTDGIQIPIDSIIHIASG